MDWLIGEGFGWIAVAAAKGASQGSQSFCPPTSTDTRHSEQGLMARSSTASKDSKVDQGNPTEHSSTGNGLRTGSAMIEAVGLSKYYGDFAAVRDATFRINRGEVVAFLGPNGAGKTTTMRLLTGYLAPTSGTARIAGFDMRTHRLEGAQRLGYLPENGPLYPDMTPGGLLEFFAQARGLDKARRQERIDAVIRLCAIESVVGKAIGKLSRGYRQRVGMAQVLLHEPQVLILDEPTAGLDPNQIREVRQTIRRLGRDKTILLSTHILQEVQAMCDRVIMINEGKLVFDGTPDELTRGGQTLDERFAELTAA